MGTKNETDCQLPQIKYPIKKIFLRYIENKLNPINLNEGPILTRNEPTKYLLEAVRNDNPFTKIKTSRISVLKEDLTKRQESESKRFREEKNPAKKLPIELRQRYTAQSILRDLITEEDNKELQKHGNVFRRASIKKPNYVQNRSDSLCQSKKSSSFLTPISQTNEEKPLTKKDFLPSINGAKVCDETGKEHVLQNSKSISNINTKEKQIPVMLADDIEIEMPSPIEIVIGNKTQKSASYVNRFSLKGGNKSLELTNFQDSRNSGELFNFMQSRRQVCLLELAMRTNENEIYRIDDIINAEYEYLKNEEADLVRKHEEHDHYLKSICQRTAEAIRLAESEANKRVEVSERIKRARYKLAHLNAGCIKLEEEFIRLSTYRDFLFRVAKKYQENRTNIEPTAKLGHSEENVVMCSEEENTEMESKSVITTIDDIQDSSINNQNNIGIAEQTSNISDGFNTTLLSALQDSEFDTTTSNSASCTHLPIVFSKAHKENMANDNENSEEIRFRNFFKSPQDLVDILAELESNNLTLIENVQEQEEMCERVKIKANRLSRNLNVERKSVNDQISREQEIIRILQNGVDNINASKSALKDFVLLERYSRVFHLGGLSQFEGYSKVTDALARLNMQKDNISVSGGRKGVANQLGGGGSEFGKSEELASENNVLGDKSNQLISVGPSSGPSNIPYFYTIDGEEHPTVALHLILLHSHIQRIYFSVYGGLEGGTKLDTLVMLRRLETSVDELCEKLEAFPRSLVLRAKKAVDERNRMLTRRKQKELHQFAHEKRLQKAIQKAREPPRWRHGRRMMLRSKPPIAKKKANILNKSYDSDEDDKSLFHA